MTAVVALLRAVNVGSRTVRSAELKAVATSLGHTEVVTYVNSGNLVLVPADGASPDDVAAGLSAAFESQYGFAVPVVARTAAEWELVVRALPFRAEAESDRSHLVVYCWDGVPDVASIRTFDASVYGNETVIWHGRETYAYYPDGIGRSKLTLPVLSKAAGRVGTARNWRTVLALQKLAQERS
ncbi:hypothetical protein Cch01nite_36460 [Cellulomonas chitinilytica]|uniref:DUF1697 domain-containing protein n=1 Tax=Cellulomonas chitinilytica TaxID=398759 RepID=A0A919P6A2_9CELL|nr:DUF1697 domain-containing protein [Cellulomonas chitinilytica]GIG22922.1 hypothetical protein Cch01nite_36460 [Cellulomonas chitinilytica]